jgi:hypothetical protein
MAKSLSGMLRLDLEMLAQTLIILYEQIEVRLLD